MLYVAESEELSRLLKEKGIDASDPGRFLDPVEAKKERLLARDEERKEKQTERHVLTKAMVNHPIPRLFVSRRTAKAPMVSNVPSVEKMSPSCPEVPEAS